MKRVMIIAAMAIALTACKKDEETTPSKTPQQQQDDVKDENVEQYFGNWRYMDDQCSMLDIKIEKGRTKNEIMIHNSYAMVKDNRFDNGIWVGEFYGDDSAIAEYSVCIGTIKKR